MKVLVIEPNKSPEVRDIPNTNEELTRIVGGYLQAIHFLPGSMVYMDENAKVREDKVPIYNKFATFLCTTLRLGLAANDWIAGTVLFVGTYNDKGKYDDEEHDIPQEIIDVVMAMHAYYGGLSAT